MTSSPLITRPISQLQLSPGSLLTISDMAWSEFEALLDELGEHRAARVVYWNGTLEIMVPLPEHERPKELISDLVKALLKTLKIPYEPFGSTTFKQLGVAGVEPDSCFYIQNAQRMIGRRRLQPGDPPPDLAIELDVTSKTTLAAYQAVGVPEVWIFDGQQSMIHVLQNGAYKLMEISPTFPQLAIAEIITQTVERSWKVGNYQALLEFEQQVLAGLKPE